MHTGFSKKTTGLIIVLLLLLLLSAVWVWYGVQLKKIDNKQEYINTSLTANRQ
jgi:F0F1-type ATP synthase membrane subunit b/b'